MVSGRTDKEQKSVQSQRIRSKKQDSVVIVDASFGLLIGGMLAFGSSGSGDGCGGKGSWDDIRPDIA